MSLHGWAGPLELLQLPKKNMTWVAQLPQKNEVHVEKSHATSLPICERDDHILVCH